MWRRLWARIRPFNINNTDDERATMLAFQEIITANYRRNVGRVLPGELPVIAPRASDYEGK